jgi:hypothetical protein
MMTATAGPGAFGPAPTWTPVELFTGEQRLACQMLLRGRLRERLLDTEAAISIHAVTTVDGRKTIPRLNGVEEGMIWRQHVVAFWTASGEPADPDAPATVDRPVLVVGPNWTAAGSAQVSAGVERDNHMGLIRKNAFCLLHNVQLSADWDGAVSSWTVPEAYVNLELAAGIYLG